MGAWGLLSIPGTLLLIALLLILTDWAEDRVVSPPARKRRHSGGPDKRAVNSGAVRADGGNLTPPPEREEQ